MFLLRNYPSTRAGTSTLTGQSTWTGVSTPTDPSTRTGQGNVPYLMLCEVAAAVRAAGRPAGRQELDSLGQCIGGRLVY
jgi:hypothetical protein